MTQCRESNTLLGPGDRLHTKEYLALGIRSRGETRSGVRAQVQGQLKGNSIILDFTPKGGPKDVEGKSARRSERCLVFPMGKSCNYQCI